MLGLAGTAPAAVMTWGAATGISGDADVSTNGALVGAFNFAGGATTVNGVLFQAFAVGSNSNTVGNHTLSASSTIGPSNVSSLSAPFSTLTAQYRALLGSAASDADETVTLTMSGLTPGQKYEFQVWVNDSRSFGGFNVDVTAGNTVTLDPNPPGPPDEGGVGQFVIGSFVANGASQAVGFFGGEVGIFNGFQLRAVPSAVPEPSMLGLLGIGLAGVGFSRRKKA